MDIISKFLSRLFCDHDYNLVNQMKIKSEFERIRNAGYTPKTYHSLEEKVITDYKCSKCNKLKRFTEVH
jgi:hypothetical protein